MASEEYDVVVVGSGAAGGMAVHELIAAGMKVLLLEAGRDYDPVSETPMFHTPQQAPLRGVATSDKPGGFYDATVDGGTKVPGEPFTVDPGSKFVWWRSRMLGGRTNHWGRVALRFGPYDFKPKSRDGLGFDWPIDYQTLAPWYDKVERLIGVTGDAHGIENTPDSPPGVLLPPPQPRAHEIVLSRAFASLSMKVAAIRAAILTQQHNGRPACLYATACTRGCSIGATFQSSNVLIAPLRENGNLTVRCNAIVGQIELGSDGNASGVTYVDRVDGTWHSVRSRAVVLAAGTGSSARILLNSDGLGNDEGLVGKYLADSLEFTMRSRIPWLEKIPPQNDDGIFTPHIYVPWWLYREQAEGALDFPRGYHIEPRGGRRMPTMDVGNYVDPESPLFGPGIQDEVRRKYGTYIFLTGEGEMIPNEGSYCELDPGSTDKWGLPVLRFRWQWSEHERNQLRHMHATFNRVFAKLGGAVNTSTPQMPDGGSANHMIGGTRMGSSPTDSVVNEFGQCWEAPNVFVLDGGTFVSSPDKNPTLTILAVAARGTNRLIQLARRGDI